MNWSQSYSASWRVFRVNRKTWEDGPLVETIDGADVSKSADGDLLESGSLTVTGDLETDYYRIVMTAVQGGEIERVNVATLLFEVEKGEHDYGTVTHSVDGYSVLYPALKTTITTGQYAPAGSDGVLYAKNLLENTINAPVESEGSFILVDHVVHKFGSSVLDAVWSVLKAGDYVMQIDGKGVVHLVPMPTEPSLVLDNSSIGMLSNKIPYDTDISSIPNRYIVIVDNNITIAVNDNPESIVSTVRRGYNVDKVDTSPILINNETLSEYANRKLIEASIMKETKSYVREYAPNVNLYSIIRATIVGLEGDLRVDSQSIKCENGITLNEKVTKEIKV